MPFPTTSVLDSGTGTNANPIGGNWSGPLISGFDQLQRTSNQFANSAGNGGDDGSWWNVATFGPDAECFVTMPTIPTSSAANYVEVHVRGVSEGTANVDFYAAACSGDGNHALYRVDNGAYTQIGAVISATFANGDSLGIEAIGNGTNNLTFYRKPSGGSWTSVAQRSDATYNAAGAISLIISGANPRCTDFGGGTLVVGGANPKGPLSNPFAGPFGGPI